jgi:hypothetical protein
VLDGELAQLPVLAVFSERVRGAEQPLQEPGGGQGLDRGDRGLETFPVAAEPAVRFRAETGDEGADYGSCLATGS